MLLKNQEAKVGDFIRAYSFENKSGSASDYYHGVVTKVEECPETRVPYVYYTACEEVEVERYSGEVERRQFVNREMRIVQNNVPSTFSGKTSYIRVVERHEGEW